MWSMLLVLTKSWTFYAWYFVGSSGNERGRTFDTKNDRERTKGRGGGGASGPGKDRINAIGRLL